MKHLLTILILGLSVQIALSLPQKELNKADQILRTAKGTYDLQQNTASNIEFYVTNQGISFLNTSLGIGTGKWPRGSSNLYIFGDGFWFGAKKYDPKSNKKVKCVAYSYNPQTSLSVFSPGKLIDGDKVNDLLIDKYRIYFSSDMYPNGSPFIQSDGPNWPLWRTGKTQVNKFGADLHEYVYDVNKRNSTDYPLGPMWLSNEDIHCVYKDSDSLRYPSSYDRSLHPLRLECSQTIYSWSYSDLKDVIVINYEITNNSQDTLWDCYFAKISDPDLAIASNLHNGAQNDYTKYFKEDSSLDLAVAWTDTDKGEAGRGFGYVGLSMLETPSIDANRFIRTDKLLYHPEEQLGITCYRNWGNDYDPKGPEEMYNFISAKILEESTGAGDKRMAFSTGPFNVKPGDKFRISVAYTFAMPAKGGEADGTLEDIAGFKVSGVGLVEDYEKTSLAGKVKSIKEKYYIDIINSISGHNNSNYKLKVFPNPAKNYIEIDINDLNTYDKMEIFSLNGTKVMSLNLTSRVDISSLENGVYFICIGNKTETFIKQ